MTDFDDQLSRAIARGQRQRNAEGQEAAQRALTDEEYRARHSKARTDLSEHVEAGMRKLADHFPGFEYQTVVGPEGWGGRVRRDDVVAVARGQVAQHYTHFELLLRPYTSTRILELVARGAIRNKEVMRRTHYQPLDQLDLETYRGVVDRWILEFAEKFAATQ